MEKDYIPSIDELEDKSEFEEIKEDIMEQSRWETLYETIYKHKQTGRYFAAYDWRGSTESQENDDEPEIIEVWPKEVTTIIYTSDKPE